MTGCGMGKGEGRKRDSVLGDRRKRANQVSSLSRWWVEMLFIELGQTWLSCLLLSPSSINYSMPCSWSRLQLTLEAFL